jgi:hypothetical protein
MTPYETGWIERNAFQLPGKYKKFINRLPFYSPNIIFFLQLTNSSKIIFWNRSEMFSGDIQITFFQNKVLVDSEGQYGLYRFLTPPSQDHQDSF